MTINKSDQTELLNRISELQEKQMDMQKELFDIQRQVRNLTVATPFTGSEMRQEQEARPLIEPVVRRKPAEKKKETSPIEELWKSADINSGLEKFIGENLINKIGILVLIIGVGIGVKYAIDNELISPLVRIILGYLVGVLLSVFAIRFKNKYLNFSAVLFSGAMAVFYFITYAAHSYYNLFPQITGIVIMTAITILTVFLAMHYNRQVIAHFGLVGAYIIPYLLKDPFSNVVVLFVYMTIINVGILIVSAKKLWKPLNYAALAATWVIFISWVSSANYNQQLGICITFLAIFFLIFHLIFMLYKLKIKEKFAIDDAIFLLLNAAVLFFTGYITINNSEAARVFLGMFTFLNSVVYAATALLVFKINSDDQKLQNWYISMALAFITLAVSVQLDKYETAIVWALEVAVVFWYGRTNKRLLFEIISFIISIALFLQLTGNWASAHYKLHNPEITETLLTVFNFQFMSSLVALAAFLFVFLVAFHPESKFKNHSATPEVFKLIFPMLLLLVFYFTFFNEISLFWENFQLKTSFALNSSGVWVNQYNNFNVDDIKALKTIWQVNYTMIIMALLAFVFYKWFPNISFGAIVIVAQLILALVFLTSTLFLTSQLLHSYLNPVTGSKFAVGVYAIIIRYIAYLFFGTMLFTSFKFLIQKINIKSYFVIFEIILSICITRILSHELISWLSVSGSNDVYKYGLSILWGVISLLLVGYGIWSRKKHLRIAGIVLLGITLLKLFFYDLSNLETIPKTLVFILTGGLLLVVSFLYNKYTSKIFGEKNE